MRRTQLFRFLITFAIAAGASLGAAAADNSKLPTISTNELAAMLKSRKQARPLLLHVGPHILYAQAHIPGSEYAGTASTPQGLDMLRKRVVYTRKNAAIVIYCGCCPWSHCPNVNPAYEALKQLGFKNVKVLFIENNFGADWVDKGFPAVGGD